VEKEEGAGTQETPALEEQKKKNKNPVGSQNLELLVEERGSLKNRIFARPVDELHGKASH